MFFKPNPTSGVPIYVQLMEQIRHSIETGALRPGDQLPAIRKVAEDLSINPNTVAKVYRELEHEGDIELRHGAGAFVAATAGAGVESEGRAERLRKAQGAIRNTVAKLETLGLSEDEMRRLFEAEMRDRRAKSIAAERK